MREKQNHASPIVLKKSQFDPAYLRPKLPSDVRIPLEQMAPLKNSLRPELEFVLNFACFNMNIDIGRTIPPITYFMIRDYLSTIPDGTSTKSAMNAIYALVTYTHNGVDFTISNLFGGLLQMVQTSLPTRTGFEKNLKTP